MNIEKFEDWVDGHKYLSAIYYPTWRIYDSLKYDLKNLYSRVRYGFEPWQVWNFNSYAVEILLPNFRRFVKSKRMGCPSDTFDGTAKDNECHKWDEELEEILWAFEYYNRTEITGEEERVPYDHEKAMADGKRMQAGFELFGKRLMGMWD